MVVAVENITGGMGTAAFVAFLMSLCNRRFSATQFALLSRVRVGRPGLGRAARRRARAVDRLAGVLRRLDVAALPALALLAMLRRPIALLEPTGRGERVP